MTAPEGIAQSASARPERTVAIVAETGLDEKVLRRLVHTFHAKIRRDPVSGPISAERITGWGPQPGRMVAFWSSVALMTGRYHGRPVPARTPLPVDGSHFDRWLGLFRETAHAVGTPAGAAHVSLRAGRIARSLRMAVAQAQAAPDAIPALR